MKFNRIAIFFVALLALTGIAKGQSLFLDGADIWIGGNAVLFVGGDFENSAGGTVDNSGQLVVGGDFLNNAGNNTLINGSAGTVELAGDNQAIGGSDTTEFYDLTLSGTGVKSLDIASSVTNSLNLNDREFNTGAHIFGVQNFSAGSVTRTTGFISSSLGGGLARAMVGLTPYLYPVGSSLNGIGYRPVEITPSTFTPTGFLVRMAATDPTSEGFDRLINDGSFCDLNPAWYHNITRLAGTDPVTLSTYFDDSLDAAYSKMGHWQNVPQWQDIPAAVLTSNHTPVLSRYTVTNWTDFTFPAFSFGGDTFSVSLASSGDTLCFGDTATFTATPGYGNYDFYVNSTLMQGGPSNIFMTSSLNTGDTVLVSVEDSSKCVETDYRVVVVGFVPVVWVNQIGVTQSNDTLFQTSGTNTWVSAGATGDGNLDAFTDGTLRHVVHTVKDYYYFGLSNDGIDPGNLSIEHAFYVYKKQLRIREAIGTDTVIGVVGVGDTLEISRVGNILYWMQNGTVVRAKSVNDAISLRPDISIFKKNSYVTNMWTDFCSGNPPTIPFTVQTQQNNNSCLNSPSGTITVFPNGGIPPYSYLWSTGDTTAMVDSLPAGIYTVTVSDNGGNIDNLSFNLYNSITWTEVHGATSSEDTLTRTLGGNTWGNVGARSDQVLLPGMDGEFWHVVHRVDKFYYIGLSNSNTDDWQTTMDYAFYVAKASLKIREENTSYFANAGTLVEGDTLKVSRVGNNIMYYKNSSLLKTTATTNGEALFVDATIYNAGVSLYDNFTTFCNDSLPPDSFITGFSVDHADCFASNGSLTAEVSGGQPPYTYAWSSLETTQTISGKDPGQYQVIVGDQGGHSDTLDLEIYAKTIWEGFIGSAATGDTLMRTAPNNGWGQSGARSDNKLLNGVDGKVVHVVNSIGYNYYIGLSNSDPDASQFTIDYAFYNNKGNLYIREEQTGFFQNYGTVAVGDTLQIERRISSMYWYQNGTQLRSIGVSPTETLRVDVSLFTANTKIYDVYVDFCDTVPGQKSLAGGDHGNEPMGAWSGEFGVNVYPNPSNGVFTVEVTSPGEEEAMTLTVNDLAGRVLFTTQSDHPGGLWRKRIEISNVTKGIYVLKVGTSQGETLHKLIIE
ncbi:MAG: T9SS type A sorting domain-containing protein [Bacteroidia bacterium]|nr:T9SS type A sorting domain-containing protein [Bacteroidia bacterium]